MKRILTLIFLFIFLFPPLANIRLISAERDPGNCLSPETSDKRAESDILAEYQGAKQELSKDYSKLRDWLVNGYLSEMLKIKYEDLKLDKRALIHRYVEGKNKLLSKYSGDKAK